uniref:Beta-1,4-galactosyltransferase n=1 Tax=Palpitomonas bilix TaxID=652834 RepID=A0A7S3G6Z3_9EUKA|mmetsp:Transcript_30917/g.81195  ORF Transcript_30917/g.81195 Transcript_30917/m.81195 type:complete len:587 (+) Transcript_30917:253-2013(+)
MSIYSVINLKYVSKSAHGTSEAIPFASPLNVGGIACPESEAIQVDGVRYIKEALHSSLPKGVYFTGKASELISSHSFSNPSNEKIEVSAVYWKGSLIIDGKLEGSESNGRNTVEGKAKYGLKVLARKGLVVPGTAEGHANRDETGFVVMKQVQKHFPPPPAKGEGGFHYHHLPFVYCCNEVDVLYKTKATVFAPYCGGSGEKDTVRVALHRAFACSAAFLFLTEVRDGVCQPSVVLPLDEAAKKFGINLGEEKGRFQRKLETIAYAIWDIVRRQKEAGGTPMEDGNVVVEGHMSSKGLSIYQHGYAAFLPSTSVGGDGEKKEDRKRKRTEEEGSSGEGAASQARNRRFSIVVPFRDNAKQNRMTQLEIFSAYMESFLSGLDYVIIIAEQGDTSHKFNRGKMLNVGYRIAKEQFDCEYHILHDVDLLPAKDLLKYYTTFPADGPFHIANVWGQYNYQGYFGGIVSISNKDFEELNGYPNDYWGWGGEDDELKRRCDERKMRIVRPTEGTILPLPHPDTKAVTEWKNLRKWELRDAHKQTWQANGLNTLKYTREKSRKMGSCTHVITCDIVQGCPDAQYEWALATFVG